MNRGKRSGFFLPDEQGFFFFFFSLFIIFFFSELFRPPEGARGGFCRGWSWMGGWIKGKREREGVGMENRPGVCVRRWGHGVGVNGGDHFCPGLMGPLIQLWIRHAYVCVCVCVCVSMCVCEPGHTRIFTCALYARVPHHFTLDLCMYKKRMR